MRQRFSRGGDNKTPRDENTQESKLTDWLLKVRTQRARFDWTMKNLLTWLHGGCTPDKARILAQENHDISWESATQETQERLAHTNASTMSKVPNGADAAAYLVDDFENALPRRNIDNVRFSNEVRKI